MRRSAAAVALALLVAFAGCSLTGRDAQTLTPADVPEDPATPSPHPTVAPGLSSRGLTQGYAFVNAHVRALHGRSFTATERHVQRYANGTLRVLRNETVRVGPDPDRYLFDLRMAGRVPVARGETEVRVQRFANGSAVFERLVLNGTATVRFVRGPQHRVVEPTAAYHGRPFQADAGWFDRARNVTVDRVGPERYRVRATGMSGHSLRTRVGTVENLTVVAFTATVRSDGLVERRHLAYRGTVDGVRVGGNVTVAYAGLGETAVAPPPWTDGLSGSEEQAATGEEQAQ